MESNRITVVICVLNDWRVVRLASSLAKQTLATPAFKVVIVAADKEPYERAIEGLDLDVRIIRSSVARLSAQRNIGLNEVDTEFFATTDADCVASPRWLEDILDTFSANPELSGVGGRIEKYTRKTLVQEHGITIDDGQKGLNYLPASRLPYITGANSSYRTAAVTKLAGYDEQFVCGDDVDISYRLQYAGGKLHVANDAVIFHEDRKSLWQHFRRFEHYGIDQALLYKKHQMDRPNWLPYINPHPALLARRALVDALVQRGSRRSTRRAIASLTQAAGIVFGDLRGSLRHHVFYL